MKNTTKLLMALTGAIGIILQSPAAQAQIAHLLAQHPGFSALGAMLTLMGGLMHDPKAKE